MPSKNAPKRTAKGFAEILKAARVAGLTAAPEPDKASARNGALCYLALNDPLMSAAIQSAREALPGFLALARHPAQTMERFAVKIALLGDSGPEFFWIHPFARVGDRFVGQISNAPFTLVGPQKGRHRCFWQAGHCRLCLRGCRRGEGRLFRACYSQNSPAA